MDNAPKPVEAVDAIVQIVVLIATGYVAIRSAVGPDYMRTAEAHVLRYAENYCQRRAVGWAHMADVCKTAYDRTRLVV